MLTGKLVARKEVPHEPGNYMEFRLLGWVALEEARSVRQTKALRAIAGVTDVVRDLQSQRTDVPATNGVVTESDPLNNYDQLTLLIRGIVSWDGPAYDVPVSPDTITQLDAATADWAAHEILNMHAQTQAEREAGLFRTGGSA